ncbi:MAG: hypothetical protein V4596_06665 [Bdellovibrionota bacterium]
MHNNVILSFIFIFLSSLPTFAQQAILELGSSLADDTLPIAHTRYDEAVEPPKDNFSSVGKQDMWEKFERGELDEKAFIKLQEDYQMQANNSKDPIVKRKIASDMKEKKKEELVKKKEERAAKLAEEKKNKKKAEANKFDTEISMMAKEKEIAQKKAQSEVETQKKAKIKMAQKAAAKKRAPSSVKKKLPKIKKK